MTDLHTEVLSAFCDGAVVDPDLLAEALANPRAREALVDFARLRAALVCSDPLPASLDRLSPVRARRATLWAGIVGAAAMLVLAVLTFTILPRSWFIPQGEAPPAPSRVVSYQPGVDWIERR
jgi:hypothetical protein